jgi:hypothetical protein
MVVIEQLKDLPPELKRPIPRRVKRKEDERCRVVAWMGGAIFAILLLWPLAEVAVVFYG